MPGNFSCRIDGGKLRVPVELDDLARSLHLRTAEELAGYAEAFPSSVAQSLGWRAPAVLAAVGLLHEQLSDAGFLQSPRQPARVYGFGS